MALGCGDALTQMGVIKRAWKRSLLTDHCLTEELETSPLPMVGEPEHHTRASPSNDYVVKVLGEE